MDPAPAVPGCADSGPARRRARRRPGPLPIVLLVAFLLAGLGGPASAQLLPPAREHWLARDTEHFTIYHRSGSDSLGTALAGIAEETYRIFAERLQFRPKGRVLVFVQERYDIVNGFSDVLAHRTIVILPNPPYAEPHGLLGHHEDWLRLAFTHEYAHTVDLEQTRRYWDLIGLATGFRYPNALRPLWTIEGFAIWCETSLGNGGRLGSPTTEMVLRADILSERFRRSDQWSGAYQPWPDGTLSYLYGAAFMEFLQDQYGSTVPLDFRKTTAGTLPFKFAGALPRLTRGRPFPLLLAEFHARVKERADSTIVWIRGHGELREGELVSRPGATVLDLLPGRTGRDLLVACDSDHREQQILRLNADSKERSEVVRTQGQDVRLSAGADPEDVTFSDLDIRRNTDLVSRLYAVEVATGEKEIVAGAEGLFEPAISPTDGTLLACRREQARSFLVRVDQGHQEVLAPGLPAGANVFHPAWAPDGKRLAVSVWRPPGRQDIFLLDTPQGPARPLTEDDDWDIDPTFAPDGRHVLFASDRSGIWNVYAMEVENRTLYRVTNVTTGAFLPKVSRDGRWIYFVRYSPEGDEIRRLPFAPDRWTAVPLDSLPRLPAYSRYLARVEAPRPASGSAEVRTGARGTADIPRQEGWDRLRSLRPALHIPLPTVDQQGLGAAIFLEGLDPLGRESYSGLVGYGLESRRLSYAGGLQTYALPRSRLELLAADNAFPTRQKIPGSETAFLWRRDRMQGVRLAWPWLETTRALESFIGIQRSQTDSLAPRDWTLDNLPRPDFLTGRSTVFQAGMAFTNTKRYPLSFSPVDGMSSQFTCWTRRKTLGGDRSGDGFTLDLRLYKAIGRDVVAATRGQVIRGHDIEIGQGGFVHVTGYDSTRTTSVAFLGAGEIRFRIIETQRKVLWDWIFLNRAHGALFLEHAGYGVGSAESWRHLRSLWSVGARLSLDVTLGFVASQSWDLILASPSRGSPSVSFGVSSAF